MPNVLTASSTVSCGHPPGTVPVVSTAKLRVGTAGVLVKTDIDGKPADGRCGIVPPPQTNKKCTTVKGVTDGVATKLTVGGNPVMLDSLKGLTDGVFGTDPPNKLSATADQTKLTSI
jgi:hypothetical protein